MLTTQLPLVVLTYPGHFLLTALTIKSYLEYHPTPSKLIIVLDDLSSQVWPSYYNDCTQLYSVLVPSCKILLTSAIPQAHKFASGWIRQQIVKLYLDTIVEHDQWFFTDGDIVFLHAVDYESIPYSLPIPTDSQNNYICRLLGISQGGVFVNGDQVCMSDPPFRTMSKKVLIDLRNHVEMIHKRPLDEVHLDYQNEKAINVSEWELIESFKKYITQENLNLVRYAPHRLENIPDNLNFFTHQFLTCYNSDSKFGREFFQKWNVNVSDDLWQILSNISR